MYSLGRIKSPEWTDAETGANEWLLFRWPPRSKPAPTEDRASETDDSAPVEEP